MSLTTTKDNTLHQYDPSAPDSQMNSNGGGDFFSAGRTLKRSQIRRGLLQFDLSAVPTGATVVPGSTTLELYVVDVPKKDPSPRSFWLVAISGLDHDWGEGASVANAGISGAGSGAPAQAGDATWFHTMYDPVSHNPTDFVPGGLGYWPDPGVLGDAPLDSLGRFGDPSGIVESIIGPVSFSSASMESDLNDWISHSAPNSGWLLIGDEMVTSDTESSNRGFASREHAVLEYRPRLTFEYAVIPEPASAILLAIGILLLPVRCSRSRRRNTSN